jgi:uncharacterized protein YjbI with pentapeptide repeats
LGLVHEILSKMPIRGRCERGFAMGRAWDKFYDWTGFRKKKLWDWMSLLVVPVFIAGATVVFSLYQQRIEADRVQQSALESYIQDMGELLLHEGLFNQWVPIGQQPPDISDTYPARAVGRTRTLTTLRQLDGERKAILLQFLVESQLLGYSIECSNAYLPECARTRIHMWGADLRGTKISDAILYAADLTGANLSGSDLIRINLSDAQLTCTNLSEGLTCTNLSGSDLNGTKLMRANLSGANLSSTNLSGTTFDGADLTRTNLSGANLTDANLGPAPPPLVLSDPNRSRRLTRANLSGANLTDANLTRAKLIGADLTDANLIGADLSNANLFGAKGWTNEQLAQAKSLVGATLPDGTVMTEEAREEFKRRYR